MESLNKKLNSIEKKINNISRQRESEKFFVATVVLSLAMVLISISLPLLIQLQDLPKYALWLTVGSYFALAIFLMFIAREFLKRQ